MTNKKALSESDICDRFITPAVTNAGWAANRWRREFGFTDGKIIVRGKLVARGKRKRTDYLLFHTRTNTHEFGPPAPWRYPTAIKRAAWHRISGPTQRRR